MAKARNPQRKIDVLCKKQVVAVYGGPYRDRPNAVPGVKMAEEIEAPFAVSIPTRDFSVPPIGTMMIGLCKALWVLRRNSEIYVGCMGGVGRTGLFMALLYRAVGNLDGEEAVTRVRHNYNVHAVETDQQKEYVKTFPMFWPRIVARVLSFEI